MKSSLLAHSRELADLAREKKAEGKEKLFRVLYTIAVLLRIVEVVAIAGIVWLAVVLFLVAGGSPF